MIFGVPASTAPNLKIPTLPPLNLDGNVVSGLMWGTVYMHLTTFRIPSGTYAQAILELESPTLTPFSPSFSSPLLSSPSPPSPYVPAAVLTQAHWALSHRPTVKSFPLGLGKILLRDDSTSDPASLITCCLLAHLSGEIPSDPLKEVAGEDAPVVGWVDAVEKQVDFLLNDVAKVSSQRVLLGANFDLHHAQTDDGALSHRVRELSLWADFVYMAPPSVVSYDSHT